MKARFLATVTACLCALLLAACDGIGTSIHAENPYGGLGGWTGDGASEGADSSGGSSLGFDAGTLLGFSNTGNVEAIVRLFTTAISNPDAGGTIDVVFSAADLGLPAGGTVTLSLRGNGIDFDNTKGADADGTVRFTVPLIASGTEITVSLTLWEADGTLACTGTKTQRVTGLSSDIAVSLSGGGSTPAPTPIPPGPAVPAGFVSIPAGTFTRGSGSTAYNVTLTKGFWMCDHEVTRAEYDAVMGTNSSSSTGDDNLPKGGVSWHSAVAYCNARSLLEGLTPCYTVGSSYMTKCDFTADGYRLPTEAEWMYAARAGLTGSPAWSGTTSAASVSDYAWYDANSGDTTHPVKTKLPNAWGLYDMSGNVSEWCWDKYDLGLGYSSDVTDPVYPPGNQAGDSHNRMLLGGYYRAQRGSCSVSSGSTATDLRPWYGLRVVRTAPDP